MTDAREWLDRVNARTNAATDGPWEVSHEGRDIEVRRGIEWLATAGEAHNRRDRTVDANAEFIAHARTDLPAATTALRAVLDRETAIRVIAAVHGVPPDLVDLGRRDDEWLIDRVTQVLETAITTELEDA